MTPAQREVFSYFLMFAVGMGAGLVMFLAVDWLLTPKRKK